MSFLNLQNNFLSKYSEVYPSSAEWAIIEYKLQLSMGSTTTVAKKIWNVSSAQLTSNFEKKNKGNLILDCYIETNSLDQNNRLQKVCQKGFEFPSNGLKFSAGYTKVTPAPNKRFNYLLCRIAVGKSYCIPTKNYQKDKVRLPSGFDSIYLYNQEESPEIFRHDYLLFDSLQVLPTFIVDFQFDPQRQSNLRAPLCDVCGDNVAKLYCLVEEANFCPECDNENHRTKLTSKHSRVDLSEKPKGFGNCVTHPDVKLELFCTVCNLPLCVNDKINGDHTTGQMGNHPIVRIKDAYSQASQKSKQLDPNLEKRKNQLAELLGNIDLKIKQINKNASAVQEQIYQLLQNALKELQEHTQKKMSYLIGDQLELKRQYDQIQWMQSFLKYEHTILMPSDFLAAWARHAKLRKQVLNLANIPIITDVKADLKVEGKIKIFTENMLKTNNNDNVLGEFNLLGKQNMQTPIKNTQKSEDYLVGSTPFRRNIFNKHQIDKNALIMKSGMTSNIKNVTPDIESPIKPKNNLNLAVKREPDTNVK